MNGKVIETRYLRIGKLEVSVDGEVIDTLQILQNGHYRLKNVNGSELISERDTKILFNSLQRLENYVVNLARNRYQTTIFNIIRNKPPIETKYS